ncbi:MAG: hypothetical protein Q8N23_25830 [Archangium sp.]|nr:hypothetical protein [Archangium sp.]MDP3571458.1 hypothetical protein [Archangium sp.]
MTFRTALVLVAFSASTAAAQRVSFPSFTGPSAASVRNQVVGAVCDTADCVSATKVTTSGKPDWKKAKKESVQFFVTGAVAKRGKALTLDLFVFTKAGAPRARKNFPLDKNGTLSPKNLQSVMDLLGSTFGQRAAPEPTPPMVEEKPAAREPTRTNRPADPPPARAQRKPETTPEAEPEQRGEPEAPSSAKDKNKPTFLVLDVGAEILNRRLEYSQVATSNLRRYDLTLYGQLAIGAEFYPLALVRDDLLAGLGLEASIAFAPWLQSRLASIPEAFPTSTLRIDAGIRFSIAPIKTYALRIAPYLGVRSHSFTVGALPDGRRLDGLPNISLVGLRAGLAIELPIVPRWLTLFGRFGVIPVFGSGEIISPAFFPNGSAFGLEGNAGLGVNLVSFLQIRAGFDFARYGFTFTTQPTDPYVAAGATDTYIGGKASLRLSF